MKPVCRSEVGNRHFPLTDYSYQSSFGDWHGYSSPSDGDDAFRRFHDFSRAFLIESARERAKEMAVFAVVVLTALWPVIYMVVTVMKLLARGRPLTQ